MIRKSSELVKNLFTSATILVLCQISPLRGLRDRVAILSTQLANGLATAKNNSKRKSCSARILAVFTYICGGAICTKPQHTWIQNIPKSHCLIFAIARIWFPVSQACKFTGDSRTLLKEVILEDIFSFLFKNSSLEPSHTCSAQSGKQTLDKCFHFVNSSIPN